MWLIDQSYIIYIATRQYYEKHLFIKYISYAWFSHYALILSHIFINRKIFIKLITYDLPWYQPQVGATRVYALHHRSGEIPSSRNSRAGPHWRWRYMFKSVFVLKGCHKEYPKFYEDFIRKLFFNMSCFFLIFLLNLS